MEEEISLMEASLPGMADRVKHRPFPVPRFITQAVAEAITQAIPPQAIEVTEELAEEELVVKLTKALPLHPQ